MHVLAELCEIPAHQREVMLLVEPAQVPDALDALTVADGAAEGVARVGGVGDQAALAQDLDHL